MKIKAKKKADKKIKVSGQTGRESITSQKIPAIKELTTLNRLTKTIAAQLSLQEACNAAVKQISRTLKLQAAVLFLQEGNQLNLKAMHSASSFLRRETVPSHTVGECLCGMAARTGRMIFSKNIHRDRRCTMAECKQAGLMSFGAIPLVLGNQRIGKKYVGVLGIASAVERDFRQEVFFLKIIADHLAISIHNAKLFEQTSYEKQFSETLLESLPGLFYLYEINLQSPADSHLIRFNKKHALLTGYSPEELKGKKVRDWFEHEMLEKAISAINTLAEKGISQSRLDLKLKDGSIVPYTFTGRLLHIGDTLYFLGVGIDISDFVHAEEALRFSEEKYRLVVENANDAIFIVQDEKIKFPNHPTIVVTGYTEEELSQGPFSSFIHPDDKEMVTDIHHKRLRGQNVPSAYSFRIVNKSGEVVWVEAGVVLVTWEGQPAALVFLRDISVQKKLEEQLLHAQKMEAIGTLAGGIAHDFNNLLMGILGYTSIMLLKIDESHPFHERLRTIEQLVESGSELTKQLLGFARGGKYEVKPINISDLIIKTSDIFGRTKKEITIFRKLQEDLQTVEADRGQIEQVLINLYVNAWQSMPSGGSLYLEAQNTSLNEQSCRPYDADPGNYVKITVTDTGAGMNAETLKRIFEPFFTTKGLGKGTGLGLASVYGIVKNHKGIINAYSEKGHGTTFEIYLPASAREVTDTMIPEKTMLTGNETILVVDDEPANTDAVKELLQILGYEVVVAHNGQEAIEIYALYKNKIQLVILDMIMPGMNGRETFEKLKEIDPDVRILLSSGYSLNGEAKEILELGCKGFIQKPFRVDELSRKIRDVLDIAKG